MFYLLYDIKHTTRKSLSEKKKENFSIKKFSKNTSRLNLITAKINIKKRDIYEERNQYCLMVYIFIYFLFQRNILENSVDKNENN